MSTTVTQKGSTLTTATNQTKTLETAGKQMEDDVTITDVTENTYTVLITGAGNSTYCYVTQNGTKYYTLRSSFNYSEGDTMTIYLASSTQKNYLYLNGELIAGDSTAEISYSYTPAAPQGPISITLANTNISIKNVYITAPILPEGNADTTKY